MKYRIMMFIIDCLEEMLLSVSGADGIKFYYYRDSQQKAIERNGYAPCSACRVNPSLLGWDSEIE